MSLLLLLKNGTSEPAPEVGANRLHVTEYPPMRQYMLATVPGGRVHRWGEDELAAANVFESLTDSDSVPGGDKEIACSLPRKPGTDYSDMKVGTRVELFGAGGRLISQCRLERTPRTSGDYLTMDPSAMGYQVLLTDDEGATAMFIGADQSEWTGPSAGRRVQWPESWNTSAAPSVSVDSAGAPFIGITTDGPLTKPVWEAVFDAGAGARIGIVVSEVFPVNLGSHAVNPNLNANLVAADDDQFTNPVTLADVSGGGLFSLPVGSKRVVQLAAYFEESGVGVDGTEYGYRLKQPIVIGSYGFPAYGTYPEIGVLASDVIAAALSLWAPSLRFTTGPFGSLKASNFPIPHLTFKEPTTVQEMITAALKFELLEWSVRGTAQGPTFFLNPRGEREGRMRWRARVRPAKLTETGQQMDQVWNRAIVSFNGTDGVQHTVGPAGSGAQYIDPRCEDTDPLNPINEAGEDRTKHLSLSTIASPEGAAEVAQRFLEQCKLLDGSGEATLTGYVEDEHGILWPYDAVKSGDLIDFVDSSVPGYRYIVEATRTRSSRSVNIKIDAPPDSYEALLERLGVRETAAGIS